jgi:hypothetical protein
MVVLVVEVMGLIVLADLLQQEQIQQALQTPVAVVGVAQTEALQVRVLQAALVL